MSLKYFHMIFICLSWLMCFFVAAWSFFAPRAQGSESLFILGVVCAILGMGLLVYTPMAWNKLKKIHIE